MHYLVAGHTKFSPDRMFGLATLAYKKKDIYEPEDAVALWNGVRSLLPSIYRSSTLVGVTTRPS